MLKYNIYFILLYCLGKLIKCFLVNPLGDRESSVQVYSGYLQCFTTNKVHTKSFGNIVKVTQRSLPPVRTAISPAINQMLQIQQTEICADPPTRGLILGVYSDEEDRSDTGILTPSGWRYNVQKTAGRMLEVLRLSGPMPKRGEVRLLFAIEPEKIPYYSAVACVGLGKECLGYNSYEVVDEQKEGIRRSVAKACMELAHLDTDRIEVESCGHAESAAEGAALGIWAYQELREPKNRIPVPSINLYTHKDEVCDIEGWRIGLQKAAAQNLTRQLQEMASNLLTPTAFAQIVVEVLCKSGVNVEVKVEGWAESQSMHSFLSVGKASCEPPIFLELSYYGTTSEERPIVLVGQGVTFDSGGLCVKELEELYHMRGDMTGAAVVVATCRAIAALRLPVNIRGLIPLCENAIGCNSFRPGDITKAMNGKTVKVQGTDHEDVLVLADALLYAQNFCPKFIVDIGTTSGMMRNALDEAACGVFTNSEILWQQIKHASMHTGDRVWRFPLWEYYTKNVTSGGSTDVQNYGAGRGGRPCKAAAFLREFVPCGQWIHIDATNVMVTNGKTFEYIRRGMAGRPTRTIIEFIAQTICKDTGPKLHPKK
ncbi:cytosol aminopeptidase-like isoform X3 [Eurosta solidaginis]|uniref:cytosol aminopeptidase-like isoform X3 n=1 Tax=Eurosta solidaginis TaxID=178769 RepID=UPI0035315938